MVTGHGLPGVLVCVDGEPVTVRTTDEEGDLEPMATEPFDPDKTTMFTAPSTTPPGPGWWLAADGEWYPPETPPQAQSPGPGYWMASDGRWYPPGPNETTTIEPVPTPNQYQTWEPEPQPHDEMNEALAAQRPASVVAVDTDDDSDVPGLAKVIGVLLVLLFIAAIALTALDITILSN